MSNLRLLGDRVPHPACCWVNSVAVAGFPVLDFRVSFPFLDCWIKWLTCSLPYLFAGMYFSVFHLQLSRRSLFLMRTASAKSGLSRIGPVGP